MPNSYQRLLNNGQWFWTREMLPDDLLGSQTQQILDTKSDFVNILERSSPETLINRLVESQIKTELLIQHCMLATDIGKETLDRIAFYFFYNDMSTVKINAADASEQHQFSVLGNRDVSVSNKSFSQFSPDLIRDIYVLLSFGASIGQLSKYVTFDRCRLGEICGDEKQIADYFADLYVLFSNQTRGRVRVKKGSAAEDVVSTTLDKVVSNSKINYVSDSRVPNIPSQGETQEFDFVLQEPDDTFIAIEVAFQETTNSTLERKARQSRELYPVFSERGHKLIHVVDGAGYFERDNALRQMIEYSDLAVTLGEIETLRSYLTN